jgi:hypothetical protein
LSISRIFSLDTKNVALICLCYVGNATPAQIGYTVRRVRRKCADAFILIALFGNAPSTDGFDNDGNTAVVVQSLQAVVEKIVAVAIRLDTKSDLPRLGAPPPLVAANGNLSPTRG